MDAYERFEDYLAFSHTPLVQFWNILVASVGDSETGILTHYALVNHFKDVNEQWYSLCDY